MRVLQIVYHKQVSVIISVKLPSIFVGLVKILASMIEISVATCDIKLAHIPNKKVECRIII